MRRRTVCRIVSGQALLSVCRMTRISHRSRNRRTKMLFGVNCEEI